MLLAPHHQRHLGVGLVADHAVDHVRADFSVRAAQLRFASSSKRAISSTTTVTSLPLRAASTRISISSESVPVR